jgi:Putative Flp pilus-assembly TadE/G-like
VRRDERGTASLMIVGFAVVAIMMVGVVVDASAAYLRRCGLDSLADGAALAAADGIQGRQVYEGGLGERARVDPAVARAYVDRYLRDSGAGRRYPGLGYTVDAGADRVVVHLTAPLDLPITPPGWDRRPVISGTAASFVVVSD